MDNISKYLEYTLLKKNLKDEDIKKLCLDAIKHNFFGICIYPEYIKKAKEYLKDNKTKIITVIDFPSGDSDPIEKGKKAKIAKDLGADEIDMVIDVLALKDKDYNKVYKGIKEVVENASSIPVKVIIETCYLNYDEKIIACALSKIAKAKFVKTSTGFAEAGANVQDVFLLQKIVNGQMGVKASGGIKTLKEAELMITAGASRIGTSNALEMV
ncbi:MAG: Deoxyribose-phosphate aldolase [Candidatus Anoxychlamydiales bacterium]|nr:Deoxyribose-phosphate aldolase [Candidatus Anoxychlamydiales bacterium]